MVQEECAEIIELTNWTKILTKDCKALKVIQKEEFNSISFRKEEERNVLHLYWVG